MQKILGIYLVNALTYPQFVQIPFCQTIFTDWMYQDWVNIVVHSKQLFTQVHFCLLQNCNTLKDKRIHEKPAFSLTRLTDVHFIFAIGFLDFVISSAPQIDDRSVAYKKWARHELAILLNMNTDNYLKMIICRIEYKRKCILPLFVSCNVSRT